MRVRDALAEMKFHHSFRWRGQGLDAEGLVEDFNGLKTQHEDIAPEVYNDDNTYKRHLNEVG